MNLKKQAKNKIMRLAAIALTTVLIAVFSFGCSIFSSAYESEAIGAAESFVTSDFREEMGIAADEIESEVIYSGTDYNDFDVHLIAVWCYFEGSSDPIAAYCVYTVNGIMANATEMLPAGYDFEANLEDLKSLFGIVDN